MQVAVIGDGINSCYYPNINNLSLDLVAEQTIKNRENCFLKENSFATQSASIIKQYAPTASIVSLKINCEDLQNNKIWGLLSAINWCSKKSIKIVQICVGSGFSIVSNDINFAVKRLTKKGIIVICALPEELGFSTPASVDGVICVKADKNLTKNQFKAIPCGIYDAPLVASSEHYLVNYCGETELTGQSNQFSAAVITAKIHELIEQNPKISFGEICDLLGIKYAATYKEQTALTTFPKKSLEIPMIAATNCNVADARKISQFFFENGFPCKLFFEAKLNSIPSQVDYESFFQFFADNLKVKVIFAVTKNQKLINFAPMRFNFVTGISKNQYTEKTVNIPKDFTLQNLINACKHLEKTIFAIKEK